MYNKVEICGVNTSRLTVLKEEEKNRLLQRTKAGDLEAREELINGNLRLVLSVIQKFAGRGDNPDDLFQVGCIGLIKSIDNFDLTQGVRFSTYAVPMIIGELRRYLRDNNMIRVSRSVRDLAYKALGEKEKLITELGREPTMNELTVSLNNNISDSENGEEKIEYTEREITDSLDAVIDPLSLYEPVYSDGGDAVYLMDQIRDKSNSFESWTERLSLDEAFEKLSEREKLILKLRFYQGKTQMEVAGEIGISQAQVSRIEKGAVDRIRKEIV